MLHGELMVRPDDAALEQGPHAFDGVGCTSARTYSFALWLTALWSIIGTIEEAEKFLK